jgi:hypothetical protein
MERTERIAFLNQLVAEEFSPDACVDGKNVLQKAGGEFAYRVFLGENLVYSIPERLVEREHEADIRQQLRDKKQQLASVLGIPIV